ncbi:uncharacterized protein ASCRUDRAFT_6768 [Ascoidea rubescens DSM 1968]|uniref:Uncharacterized protein n=1 Tax=Ascoidea rubescens DSM 1968 TaxID=1344418 RepID=A0A1D2VNM1_9ASCO|nr:hypothetical protein ASCRUDRAFT_6768 [Ascoidea rubescens DSM 1968]ODV63212.1 hypothetical protein ASCRUDRAFT_6768 [Ascoidea rubescens DSM 1968]
MVKENGSNNRNNSANIHNGCTIFDFKDYLTGLIEDENGNGNGNGKTKEKIELIENEKMEEVKWMENKLLDLIKVNENKNEKKTRKKRRGVSKRKKSKENLNKSN